MFSLETFSFLEHTDLKNLTCLSRKLSQTFLKYNQRVFVRHYNLRIKELQINIKDIRIDRDL